MSGHTRTAARLPVTGHSKIDASICANRKPRRSGACVGAGSTPA
jgi:hypothetical protein